MAVVDAESRRISASEFIALANQKAREVGEAVRRGLRDDRIYYEEPYRLLLSIFF